ncbi:MAG TPA: methyltransferase domain-containing protein [Ktedonobacterales bacterium]|nr:methyltransferase domain-containing protein [Ktedonobacterales bacterium]
MPRIPIVLSHVQIESLLRARDSLEVSEGEHAATTSADLGRSETRVTLDGEGVHYPSGERLRWKDAARIVKNSSVCFTLSGGEIAEIRTFSQTTNWVRSLYPTRSAPTMLVSGVPMHRIKDTDPWRDTLAKAKTIAPIIGRVLDTATGLGYTAIVASETAAQVVTIELDPAGLDIARQNPWSRELFERANIQQLIGDAGDILPTLEAASFARIVHDPPQLSLAGHLYSEDFYRELRRVLARGGRLFHYIGDPASPFGSRTTSGVMRRLRAAGFGRVVRRPEAFGVVAYG